ncbi:cation-transporting P-type ATPase [Thiothrix subterranea]|uniref:Cation-transporting P-type ATPase n=2 Tax=Thiothrix subterranea TaxID=2735563 RepID=A0AA51MJP2_9GAMM|nr:cation-transporting P-type ATPase [Thiothrix subterranea]MDQ5770556.1 cation-transporting P-type ATPase [Thiothrix subterranea]WML85744.1 cation-transporting P-type ATPase [Thiothrix subterranea]
MDKQAWHALPPDDTLTRLGSQAAGLDTHTAQERHLTHGANRLPAPPKRSPVIRFLLQFHNILIYVLLAAAAVTALLDHWVDTSVIVAVVLVNAIIGFLQEGKAEQAMAAIRQMLAPQAAVLRDGKRTTIAGEMLVPGDIVLLEAGDKVPADLRLLQAYGLQVQEAILTGESVPVDKQVESVPADAALGDRTNLAFSGTTVTSGQAQGVVVAIGGHTEIGRISGLLAGVETLTTPLVEQMSVFAKWLTLFILTVAALILAFGYFVQHQEFAELFMAVVGLSVAAIPEGLPAVLTITLAVGVQAMAKRNAIVRRLPAIETIGAVSVICTDKTGTLTRNEMLVASVITVGQAYSVDGEGYSPQGNIEPQPKEAATVTEIGLAALLCNDAELKQHADTWQVEGDPMEGALLAFAAKTGHHHRSDWTRTDVIPFDSRHKFMASLHHNHTQHAHIIVKGAPEVLLAMCQQQRSADGQAQALDSAYWQQQAETIAARGQRVLAFASRTVPPHHTVLDMTDVQEHLTLLGLVGLIDPPRPEAVAAIAECHRAGIRVKMITGDHAATAAAIGQQVGLQYPDKVLTGGELDLLNDAELASAVLDHDVFARTTPEHKLRLVTALQAHGLIVAMTGDGVNDAPALKRADAGIAMGNKGSAAAKEAAELVLADDNFASIVAAVREGRTVYDNIKKVISWTLPTSTGEAAVIVLALLLGMLLPITPLQILWVNMITAATLGLALAFEPTESNTMQRPPRPRDQPILSGGLLWHIVLVTTLFLCGVFAIYAYALDQGYSLELARTLVLNTLVVMEIFHLFFIRNLYSTSLTWQAVRGTKMVWLAVVVVIVAQAAITYLPALQAVFGTQAVGLADGLLVLGMGVVLFVLVELEKQIRLHL